MTENSGQVLGGEGMTYQTNYRQTTNQRKTHKFIVIFTVEKRYKKLKLLKGVQYTEMFHTAAYLMTAALLHTTITTQCDVYKYAFDHNFTENNRRVVVTSDICIFSQ